MNAVLMEPPVDLPLGGYDHQFLDPGPTDDQKCPICHLVVRDAYQVNCCGKLLCKGCLMRHRERSKMCPMCRESIGDKYFKDTKSDREIKSLKVSCKYKEAGCKWSSEVRDIEDHLKECLYQEMKCDDCNVEILKINLATHLSTECRKRKYKCPMCDEKDTYECITNSHPEVCPEAQLECHNTGCAQQVKRCEMESHIEVCPKQVVECPFRNLGCHFASERENSASHIEKGISSHVNLLARLVQKYHPPPVVKVTNISLAKNESKYSNNFYSGVGGYKLRIFLYTSKSSHIAVYLQLLPGENDDTLQFPVRGKFTITLLNQIEDCNHHEDVVTLNDQSDRLFCRKHKEDSTGWGFPRFIPHASLQFNEADNTQYLKDGTVYFRVTCAITSQTKPWLAVNTNSCPY